MSTRILAIDTDALEAVMVATILIFVKVFITQLLQGGSRFKGGFRAAEDEALRPELGKQGHGLQSGVTPEAQAEETRWARIVANDAENLPYGLIIAWAGVLVAENSTTHAVSVYLFAFSRIAHTAAYMYALQPWRTIAWAVGVLSMWIMVINTAVGVF